MNRLSLVAIFFFTGTFLLANIYNVGPNQPLANISDVPWESLQAGDKIYIHWRNTPYREKWVINAQGTETDRIEIIGVSGPNGEKPIIDGDGATTRLALDYWGEERGVIKIGGSSIPSNGLPSYITIENLEIKSGRPAYQFTDDNGQIQTYADNAASIYVEKGEHIIIRDCIIHDSGNGIFVGASGGETQDILISKSYIYDNGIENSEFEHNTYTSALGITYEFNRFGPLRTGATGNNLKDRSAGTVVRYNWIEGGNRQLDLVEVNGTPELYNDPSYRKTFVYGNILIEPENAGNSQLMHYGGDLGNPDTYRKGELFFYNNTAIATRSTPVTLVRLSTQDETMHAFNNVFYTPHAGGNLALMNDEGTLNIKHNWFNAGWVDSHNSNMSGTINDLGGNIEGTDPLFEDFDNQDFHLTETSPLVDEGDEVPDSLVSSHNVLFEYVKHSSEIPREADSTLDIGAYEYFEALMPIYLNNFSAQATKSGARLEWSISNPLELQFFVVEHSTNGQNWTAVQQLSQENYPDAPETYSYEHLSCVKGPNYYRIYMVDLDGYGSYTPIRVIWFLQGPTSVDIYPNPSRGLFFVSDPTEEVHELQLYNPAGQFVRKETISSSTSEFQWRDLPKGNYIIVFKDKQGQTVETQSLLIQ